MGKVDKKLVKKNVSKLKSDPASAVSKAATNNKQLIKASGNENVIEVISKKDVTFSSPNVVSTSIKDSSDADTPTINFSNRQKKRVDRREARASKLHERGIAKRKNKVKVIAKKVIKGKTVDDLISTDLVTKSQSTIEKSKKLKGRNGRKNIKKKVASLEESLSELSKVDLNSDESKNSTLKNKKEKRKQKRDELISKLHGGIEKRKKKPSTAKKIVEGNSFELKLKTLFEAELVVKPDITSKPQTKEPKKLNPKVKDRRDRRIGFDAIMDVHKNADYQKDPFEMMSRVIRESVC